MPPDDAYTMQPGIDDAPMEQGVADQALSDPGMDPSMAAPAQMDPGMMAQLFGDETEGQEMPVDETQGQEMGVDETQGQEMGVDETQGQEMGGDQAPDQVDQDKLQSVLSDPSLLAAVAQVLKTLGTGEDTDLVHVTDQEKEMLKQAGGSGTPNPTTGLLQYTMPLRPGEVPGQPYPGDTPSVPDTPETPDWFGMHPDARVSWMAGNNLEPPGWGNNWWGRSRRDATQGGFGANFTGRDFANANVAVTPSWGTALNMAGLVMGLANPVQSIVGGALRYGIGQLASEYLGDDSILAGIGDFNTPGPRLSQEAVDRIAAAIDAAPMGQKQMVANREIAKERGLMGGGPGAQTGGVAAGSAGGIGVDKSSEHSPYGTNIGGGGMSHNLLAAGGDMGAVRAMADRARAFAAGGYGRAIAAGSGGRGGGGSEGGGGRSDGGNRGGGQEGGRHGGPGGSNRSD